MNSLGKICILGGGTWGTALAKIVLMNHKHINWFMRRDDQIDGFYKYGRNPNYLTNVKFNLAQISFSSNIEKAIKESDTIIIALPSPYIKQYFRRVSSKSLKDKFIVSALKGLVPGDNTVISNYFNKNFNVPIENLGVISGPCHAEEVALEKMSFLTIACKDIEKAKMLSESLNSRILKTSVSQDVVGTELAAVLKNIYAIVSGICSGQNYGDNFQAVLMTNCAKEMDRFLQKAAPLERNICEQHYLGDMLVTGYSQFSRNRTFGTMIGKGYSVKSAQLEMEMIAEGYFGAKCIYEINQRLKVDTPIIDMAYEVLYEKLNPSLAVRKLIDVF